METKNIRDINWSSEWEVQARFGFLCVFLTRLTVLGAAHPQTRRDHLCSNPYNSSPEQCLQSSAHIAQALGAQQNIHPHNHISAGSHGAAQLGFTCTNPRASPRTGPFAQIPAAPLETVNSKDAKKGGAQSIKSHGSSPAKLNPQRRKEIHVCQTCFQSISLLQEPGQRGREPLSALQ